MRSLLLSLSLLAVRLVSADAAPEPTPAPDATLVARQAGSTPLPLTEYHYNYSNIPYKVNPFAYLRGPQSGYNICNSTTEGPDSECQTAILNSISDFCLWGSPTTDGNGTIGDVEAAVVAYCTRSGHGARILPPGTITALQFMRTSAYIQVVGLLNQVGLNLQSNDTGGELDPHGDDSLGNPLGGLVYSTGLPSGNNNTIQQVVQWNNFVGGGQFCFKLCDPSVTSPNYCQNKFDLIGCAYNAPASYTPNLFVACEGELQDEAGIYTDNVTGQTMTYSQPSSLTPGYTLPYTPRIPASSNCVTYQSTNLFPSSLLGYQSTAISSSTTSSAAAPTSSSTGSDSRSGALTSTPVATSTGSVATTSTTSTASTQGQIAASAFALMIVCAVLTLL